MKDIGKHPFIIEYIEFGKYIERIFKNGENKRINYLALSLAENKSLLDYLQYQKEG